MPLHLLLDENLRDRGLWSAITQVHNELGGDLDIIGERGLGRPELGVLPVAVFQLMLGEPVS